MGKINVKMSEIGLELKLGKKSERAVRKISFPGKYIPL